MQSKVSSQKTTSHPFKLNGKICQLKSSYVIQEVTEKEPKNEILNFPSFEGINSIQKVFTISTNNKLLTFKETLCLEEKKSKKREMKKLEVNEEVLSINKTSKAKKVVLFKDSLVMSSDNFKKDKKNIVKNVVNSFLKFLRALKEKGRDLETEIEQLNKLISSKKYNNQLITSIIKEENLRACFKFFLSTEAQNWLGKSKINNKQTYKEVLNLYGSLCNRESGSEEGPSSSGAAQSQPENQSSSNNSLKLFRELGNNELQEILRFK